MIERLQGKVSNISVIQHLKDNLDLCEIQIDFDNLKIFYDANELMQFIGQDVEYTVRPDMVNGKLDNVICELAVLSTIQTVASTDNVKLIPEGNKRTMCNIESRAIRFGDFYPNCVALMSGFELGSSNKSKWFDCKMIDKVSKEFSVRLFATNVDYDRMVEVLSALKGGYVTFDLESTKYGYQTKEIIGLPNTVEESPEVVVAKEIIRNLIMSDSALQDYDRRYNVMENLAGLIDGEPGYVFVRMASELYMINAIDNISTDLDIRSMKRAVICSRGYLLPHKANWSRPFLNLNRAMSIPSLKEDSELMFMMDVLSEEESSETKLTYIKVKGLVNDIIDIRRGVQNEKNSISNDSINAMSRMFNGLL